MSIFPPLPLGQPIPDSPHAVSCSLPTMRDVIGYEEKHPETVVYLTTGYPRFVLHPWVRQLGAWVAGQLGRPADTVWLTTSARLAGEVAQRLADPRCQVVTWDGLAGLAHAPDADLGARVKTALQNTGGFLSSRAAEEQLVRLGQRAAVTDELTVPAADAEARVQAELDRAFPGTTADDRRLAANGMNAIQAAWRAATAVQTGRGRTVWIQLGWLYLDTIALLRRLTATPADYVYLPDVTDVAAVRQACAAAGDRLAGLVTEAPTNPLVQTPDLAAVSEAVWAAGGLVLVDPTLVSPFNVEVLPWADLVTMSLTKYAGNAGDLVAGVTVVNPARPDAAALRERVAALADPLHARDLARLAWEIGDFADVVARANVNAAAVVAFLRQHPGVREVWSADQPATAAAYRALARSDRAQGLGGIVSFRVQGPLAAFYDRLVLPKGPSFGMRTTLICPFIYLAHYDLVTSEAGRAELAASGLHPELLRLALGTEPAEAIIAALRDALEGGGTGAGL
jgi:cystathionine beta-lyase/cystathionine gamma-synthase